ncbi:AraC family transcriptional regulator [Coraliomargarita parva]|uniref:AraC family transcriptional regulator n=1 Tax=Coraliomargarita parva TaxID=3014050 RepID=UPI0022B3DFF4|nr:helix-turn-helix domain-containing protein [Coraliomargarita parva]
MSAFLQDGSTVLEDSLEALLELYDELNDVLFWIKDRELRIVALNRAFADRVKREPAQILGKTDADLYYPELARVFMEDDQAIMRTGRPIRRKVELLTTSYGGIEWRTTTKLPIRNRAGEVVGTSGLSRPLIGPVEALPDQFRAFAGIVEYARTHLRDGVTVVDLAHFAGMSVSTLGRRFREHLRLAPSEFLSQLRISHACQLLADSPLNVSEIGFECGFENAAAFSRAFRMQMRLSPSAYRRGEFPG